MLPSRCGVDLCCVEPFGPLLEGGLEQIRGLETLVAQGPKGGIMTADGQAGCERMGGSRNECYHEALVVHGVSSGAHIFLSAGRSRPTSHPIVVSIATFAVPQPAP